MKVRNLMVPDSARFPAEYRPSLLNGVEVVTGKAVALSNDAQGQVLKPEQDLTRIPYCAWANRGRGQMAVWMPDSEAVDGPAMVTASGRPQQRNVEVIKDDEIPSASNDHASHWRFFPARIRAVFAVRAAHEDLRGELP